MNKSLHTHLNVRSLYESLFSCLIVVFLLASCQSYKKVPYLQDAGVVKDINQQENLYDAKIMPKDLLTIVVSCTSPELAVPFNLTVAGPGTVAIGNTQLTAQPVLQPYLVDNEGKINFPVLGELKVGGLTKKEAEQLINMALFEYQDLEQTAPKTHYANMAYICNNYGMLLLRGFGKTKEAILQLKNSLGMYRKLENDYPDSYFQEAAMVCNNIANILQTYTDDISKEVEGYYQEAITIIDDKYKHS